ncbi:MAG: type II toxin-antitoxin system MqsA family antitoxin [Bacteroidota bacterium]|nr:type II toxin-antitoxin system MqsA family antitoxin [Bacteroidota bacterium]MDP4228612.1 type II toxin-antitoxin system MqsA family antitoxin [Bacteroidota bacterium]
MECVICKNGTTFQGLTTVTLNNDKSVVVIKEVPAQICNNCGHYYLDDHIAEKVMALAREISKKGVEIEVTRLKLAS